MSELKNFKLPDVGEGLTEAEIVKWHVQPGDKITVNQIIVDIETAKAVVELPSPYAGVVADLLVPEGATADVGTPIIAVDTTGGAATGKAAADTAATEDIPAEALAQRAISETEDLIPAPPVEGAVEPGIVGSPAPKAERQAVLVGYGVKLGTTSRRARKSSAGAAAAAPPATPPPPASPPQATPTPSAAASATLETSGHGQSQVLAKPPVRKMAKDLGVDLAV